WDLAAGKALLRRAEKGRLYPYLFSPDAKVVLGSRDVRPPLTAKTAKTEKPELVPGTTEAVLREVATGRPLLALPQPDHGGHPPLGFAPGGRARGPGGVRAPPEGEGPGVCPPPPPPLGGGEWEGAADHRLPRSRLPAPLPAGRVRAGRPHPGHEPRGRPHP